jgi:hypothetical protein
VSDGEGAGPAGDDADGADERRSRNWTVIGMMLLGLVIPAVAVAVAWKSCGQGAVAGRLDVKGSSLGSWVTILDRCTSGAAQGIGGVELGSRAVARPSARIEIDPIDGPSVTLWSPDGKGPLLLRRKDCAALKAELRPRGENADGVASRYDGKVEGTCPLPGGGTVTIDAWWRDCAD